MGRPPLALGTPGKTRTYRTPSGWRARTMFRDFDGVSRPVEKSGKTEGAALRGLAEALRDRVRTEGGQTINGDSKLVALAEYWFATIQAGTLSPSTVQLYRDRLDHQILPALGNVRVRELSVGLVDRFLAAVKAKHGPSLAKTTKSVLSGCRLACRQDALVSNPCRDVGTISTRPKKAPRALSIPELMQLRAFLTYDDLAVRHGLPDLVAFLSATGMRIGEACALSWDAVSLEKGTVEVRGTVLRVRGEGLVIKPAAKTTAGRRTLELPSWCVEMLRVRKAASRGNLVLASPLGMIRDPSNTRRRCSRLTPASAMAMRG
jgi:integrase